MIKPICCFLTDGLNLCTDMHGKLLLLRESRDRRFCSDTRHVQTQVFDKHDTGNSTPLEEGKLRSTFIHSERTGGCFTDAMTTSDLDADTQTHRCDEDCQHLDLVVFRVFNGVNSHMAVQIYYSC